VNAEAVSSSGLVLARILAYDLLGPFLDEPTTIPQPLIEVRADNADCEKDVGNTEQLRRIRRGMKIAKTDCGPCNGTEVEGIDPAPALHVVEGDRSDSQKEYRSEPKSSVRDPRPFVVLRFTVCVSRRIRVCHRCHSNAWSQVWNDDRPLTGTLHSLGQESTDVRIDSEKVLRVCRFWPATRLYISYRRR
jgi:hypothetical protein